MVLDALAGNDVHLKRKTVLNNLFAHLRDQDMLPAICFVFSRKAVEQCAQEIKGTDGSLMNPPINPYYLIILPFYQSYIKIFLHIF